MLGWLKWGAGGVQVRTLATLEDALRTIRELAQFSKAAAEVLTELSKLPILQGKLIAGLTTDGSIINQNYFPHGLGRPFKGAIMLGQNNSNATLTMLSTASVLNDSRNPELVFGTRQAVAAVPVTFSAWVF